MNGVSKRKLYRIVLIVFTIMLSIGGFLMLLLSQAIHYYNKPSPSAITKGNIYVTRPAARKQAAQCAIIYEVNGKKYENYGTGCSWFNSGDEVTVYYKTDDPTKASIDARNVGYLFGFGGLILAFAAYFLVKNFPAKPKEQ
jgi:hypothetical protein